MLLRPVGDLIIVSRHLKLAGFPLFQDLIDSYIFAIRSQNCDGLEPNIRSPLLTARTQAREKKKKEDKKKDDAKHRQELIDNDMNDPERPSHYFIGSILLPIYSNARLWTQAKILKKPPPGLLLIRCKNAKKPDFYLPTSISNILKLLNPKCLTYLKKVLTILYGGSTLKNILKFILLC